MGGGSHVLKTRVRDTSVTALVPALRQGPAGGPPAVDRGCRGRGPPSRSKPQTLFHVLLRLFHSGREPSRCNPNERRPLFFLPSPFSLLPLSFFSTVFQTLVSRAPIRVNKGVLRGVCHARLSRQGCPLGASLGCQCPRLGVVLRLLAYDFQSSWPLCD